MEFRDLKTQYRENASLIDAQIKQVLQAGNFIGGEQVKELEDKLAEAVLSGEIERGCEVAAGISKKEIKFVRKTTK